MAKINITSIILIYTSLLDTSYDHTTKHWVFEIRTRLLIRELTLELLI